MTPPETPVLSNGEMRRTVEVARGGSRWFGPTGLSGPARTDLPANTTVHTLLGAIRNIGRIYCSVISPPNPQRGLPSAAAKVVFFDQNAAQLFWDRYGRGGRQQLPFVVDNVEAIVHRNRVRVEAQNYRRCSRVLCVSGRETLIDVNALVQEFQESFCSEMDQILVRPAEGPDGILIVEFHFGSFRCQSQTGYRLLHGREGFDVWFGRDPCE
ncbi:hypothetical protein NEMBOFW57_007069 [Staphylotrichum longicolle]|uniref:Uncharacterized protein n=1 Tax=Staphylotrichum longicolle TaxID=669026 RepID=A0AAD4EXN3_9PEZI|nr:hypothetical protein NEMBOFW57_007069 [Staphylotrichum longicolle]